MNDNESRNKLLEYLKTKNLFGVVWYGHFNNWFVAYDFNHERCPVDHIDIYSAMYEEYYDKYDIYHPANTIKILENDSWSSILMKLSLEIG